MTWVSVLRAASDNKVGLAIAELHRVEDDLVVTLERLADQQRAEHEIHHVALDIARWSREHARRLAEVGEEYGVSLDPEPSEETGLMARARDKGSELLGRSHAPALVLLADLRHVHRTAAGASLDWEVLAQAAQAMKDEQLLGLASDCHPQTLRQMRWANAKVKELSAQAILV